jgi:hypothetical protein
MKQFYQSISTLAQGRVFAFVAPADAVYPLIVYTPIEVAGVMALDGLQGLNRSRVQVDAYATVYTEALALQDQVLEALVADDTAIVDVRMGLNEFDEDALAYRISVDYTFYVQAPLNSLGLSA